MCYVRTLICSVRRWEVTLLPIGQTSEPPVVVVFVEHLDDVSSLEGQLVRAVGCVVVQRDHLGAGGRRRTSYRDPVYNEFNSAEPDGGRSYSGVICCCVALQPGCRRDGAALEEERGLI